MPYTPPPPPDRPSQDQAADVKIVFESLGEVKAKPVRWLVRGRIPLGKVTLIAGDGGVGKSTLIRHLTACLTTGRPAFGAEYDPPPAGAVVLLANEDGYEDVVVPGLVAEGADMGRVERVQYVVEQTGSQKVRVHFGTEHLAALRDELGRRPGVLAIIIDPVSSMAGRAKIDDFKQTELRPMMDSLTELADRTGVAVIVIAHVSKATGAKAMYRVAGSAAYVTAVRLAYMIAPHPDDPDRHLLMKVKGNLLGIDREAVVIRQCHLSPTEAAALRAHPALADLTADEFAQVAEQMARVEFDPPVTVDADQVMGQRRGDGSGPKVRECIDWLLAHLARFAFLRNEVFAAGDAKGFGKNLIYEARKVWNEGRPDHEQIWATNRGVYQGPCWWGIGDYRHWTLRPDQADDEDAIRADLRREAELASGNGRPRENADHAH